jgi:hypothetical protein
MQRSRTNYWVDVGNGLAGLVSAASGLVFLLPGDPTAGILGVSYQVWNSLHTWSSLAAIAGVVAHLALHWKWMVAMTRQTFSPAAQHAAGQRQCGEQRQGFERVPESAPPAATGGGVSRRAFLALDGAATVVAGLMVAGYKALTGNPAEASSSSSQLTATDQGSGVACPRGLINDPYPGRCHFYVDSDGDGICDYSVPGSGNSLASNSSEGGFSGGFHRGPGMGRP